MLKLKNISKSYKTGEFNQKALNKVNIEFRKSEFVSILGASGSGKTTLLNIIGGLDRYDSGDLIINNKSTKNFKNKNWDSYRNNCVGFIFQNYNLISHISILDNVEMSMTLSGVGRKKRRKKAKEILKKVGLIEHIHKKPNQLSGGQMQRVAIARALVNDPDIILADEPTGALDSKTSIQIMELIKEIAKDKLVIMVTHNPELAKDYSTRIIELKDGKLISDSNPIEETETDKDSFIIKKTSMSFIQALKLSFNNIKTKKGRTLLTAFASSIGIIGIALILALSNGFDLQIDKFEQNTLSSLPIVISETAMNLDPESLEKMMTEEEKLEKYSDKEIIYPFNVEEQINLHMNKIDENYVNYVEKIDNDLITGITYGKITRLNTLIKNDGVIENIDLSNEFFMLPTSKDNTFINTYYDLIYGSLPENKEDIILIVDSKNRIKSSLLELLGYDKNEEVSFKDIVNKEIKVAMNNDYYKNYGDFFMINTDLNQIYNSDNTLTLKISGIIRGKEDKETLVGSDSGLSYTNELIDYVSEKNKNSDIVKEQLNKNYNVLTGEEFKEGTTDKENILKVLGYDTVPSYIYLFPKDFDSKNEIIDYLDDYNKNLKDEDKIIYLDQASIITSLSGSIMDAITIVLIAFSAISLIVSSIMIGIITYISVLERTKEIGILRSLGARGKDISRVFTAEVFIIGLTSGLIGLLIARLLCFPANAVIESLTDLPNVSKLSIYHSIVLLIVSIILTLIGGYIPAKMASKKDPVKALRTE